MKTYKVAVVIPTLNEEKFIKQCIDSVICQTFPFDEMDVMVIDGGSSDNTRNIVSDIANKYPNVRLLLNPGKIQSIAFNIGVKESTAPYIVRLDAHALYNNTYIEKCLEKFHATSEELGCPSESLGNVGGVWQIRPQYKGLIPEASAILNKSKFGIGGATFRIGGKAGVVDTVPFGCFPRAVIDRVGGMREDLPRGEDNEINSRIRKFGYNIYFDPDIISTYFSRDTIKANMKQMYANGLSIGKLLYIDHKSIGIRHLVPFAFVTAVILGLVLGWIWFPLFGFLCLIMTAYLLSALIATILACKKYSWKYITVLPLMFFLIHVSYGLGTLVGILKIK